MDQHLPGFQGTEPSPPSVTFQERVLPRPFGLESIIDDPGDDRAEVDDAGALPWRMVCALEITGNNGLTMPGTGWLVGPRTVITAGHCVFDGLKLGGFANSITVTPGRKGLDGPFGTVPAINFRTLQRWVDEANPEFDIGSVTLASDIGLQVGFFAVGVRPADTLKMHTVHVSGYPLDLGGGVVQFHHRHRIIAATARRLFYTADTSLGQSGAPVWIVEAVGGSPMVVGIHTYGNERTPAALQPANSGTLVTTEVLAQIEEWIAADRNT